MVMHKILPMTMLIFAVLSMDGGRNAAGQGPDISQYRWKNRLLLIFAPDRSHPMFDALHRSLSAQEAEVSDRDLVVFEILESEPSSINGAVVASDTAHALRDKYTVSRGEFRVILVGKDGGLKLKRNEPTNLKKIFSLIDSMPMRQEEMRQRSD